MSLDKDALRKQALTHRANLDKSDPSEDPDSLAELFFETFSPDQGTVIACYWPKNDEFDTLPLIDKIFKTGCICALPVIQKDSRVLQFAKWQEGDPLTEGPYKILQPQVNQKTEWLLPDIVCVPLLAFDTKGHRLGYGGGYYDATLESLSNQKPDVISAGIAYAKQAVLFGLPHESHDYSLDWVITPQNANKYKN